MSYYAKISYYQKLSTIIILDKNAADIRLIFEYQIRQIMKTLQTLTQHQFSQKQVLIGEKMIENAAVIFAFAILLLPFVLLLARFD